MTADQFKDKLEKLFGNYNDEQGKYVVIWAKRKNENVLNMIVADLIRTWSLKFKAMPFITDFEDSEGRAIEKISKSHQPKYSPEPVLSDEKHAELLGTIHNLVQKMKGN